MNAWPFVIAAWGLTLGTGAVVGLLSYRAMRRAEAAAEKLTRR